MGRAAQGSDDDLGLLARLIFNPFACFVRQDDETAACRRSRHGEGVARDSHAGTSDPKLEELKETMQKTLAETERMRQLLQKAEEEKEEMRKQLAALAAEKAILSSALGGANLPPKPASSQRKGPRPSPAASTPGDTLANIGYQVSPTRSARASTTTSIPDTASSAAPSPAPSISSSTNTGIRPRLRSSNLAQGGGLPVVEVTVYGASGLLGAGVADLFVSMKLWEERRTTSARPPQDTPANGGSIVSWAQTFLIPCSSPLRSSSLRVRLYARKKLGRKQMLGEAHVHLRSLVEAGSDMLRDWFPLSGVMGQVELRVGCHPAHDFTNSMGKSPSNGHH